MIDILYLGLIILVATSFGKRVLILSKFNFNSPLEGFVFSTTLGLGILGYLVLGLGLAGWLYKWVIYLLLGLVILISVREIKDIVLLSYKKKAIFTQGRSIIPKLKVVNLCLLFLLTLHITLNLLSCLAPPSASDPLTYHLAIPKLYIQQHRITYLPQLWFSNLPFTLEMLFSLGMLLSSDRVAALIHFFFGVLVLVTIISFCHKNKIKLSLLAGAIFYSSAIVTFESTSAFVDLGLTLFGLLAVYAFLYWQETKQRKWLLLSGIFVGFASGTKYLGLIPLIVILIILVIKVSFLEKTKFKYTITNLNIFILSSGLVASPWYLKSWILTGNSVFPFFFKFFSGKDWNITSSKMLMESLSHYGMGYSLKSFLLAPWNVTLHGEAFVMGEAIGPLFLSFLPFLIFYGKDNKVVRNISVYCALYFPFWFFLSQQGKFLLPLIPFLSIITSYIISRLFEWGGAIKYATFLVVMICFIFNCAVNIIFNAQFLPVVLGFESKDSFLSKKTKFYDELMYINQHLPPNSKLLVWVRDRYYLEREYIPADPTEQGLIDYTKYNTAEELLLRLKELDITHILKPKQTLIEDFQVCHQDRKQFYRLQYEMEQRYLKPIYKKKAHFVQHRTLLREPQEIDIFIYEVKYP